MYNECEASFKKRILNENIIVYLKEQSYLQNLKDI